MDRPDSAERPVFRRRTELLVKLLFLGGFASVGLVVVLMLWRAGSYEPLGEPQRQPIPFSHKHHVGDDGIDCRYCHTTVETGAYAGLPSTGVCLSCHSQLFKDQPLLALLRRSAATGQPIAWRRVHQLPDFVYFNHSVHVNKGVACIECHGRVDQMPLTWRVSPMQMQWCLGCHRNPAPHLRPTDQITSMKPLVVSDTEAQRLVDLMALHDKRRRTDCSTCHR
ncbi:cytochrome c3 family protein [Rhizobacter fulvus]